MVWFLYDRDLCHEKVKLWETIGNYISLSFRKIIDCRPRICILPNSFVEQLFFQSSTAVVPEPYKVFQIALKRWVGLQIMLRGGIAQGILSIFRGFCDAQINIPYI